MEKILVVLSLIWAVGVFIFFINDLIKGFWGRKDMVGVPVVGGVYALNANTTTANISNGSITLGGTSTTSISVNSPMQTTKALWVEDIDVGETLRLLTFFLQSRHPEVFEEYKAIKKIEQS